MGMISVNINRWTKERTSIGKVSILSQVQSRQRMGRKPKDPAKANHEIIVYGKDSSFTNHKS